MANIQQGLHSADQLQRQASVDPSLLQQQQKDRVDRQDSVNRGYSEQNTVSTHQGARGY